MLTVEKLGDEMVIQESKKVENGFSEFANVHWSPIYVYNTYTQKKKWITIKQIKFVLNQCI